MFYRWGLFAYRHRRVVPLVVIAFIVALFALAGTQLGERMSQEGWDDPNSSSTQAAQIEQEIYGRDNQGDVILLVTAPEGKTVDDPTLYKAMGAEVEKLKANPQVETVTSYFTTLNPNLASADKKQAFAAIGLNGDGEQTLKDFRAIADQFPSEVAGATVQVAGATAVADALDRGMSSDISRAEVVALPAVGILLLIVFGSVVAACMPLLVGILSILGSLGILSMSASMDSTSSAGVPPMWRETPSGASIFLSWSMTFPLSLRSAMPAVSTVVLSTVGLAPNLPVSPSTLLACTNTSASCCGVAFSTTSLTGSVRMENVSSNSCCA